MLQLHLGRHLLSMNVLLRNDHCNDVSHATTRPNVIQYETMNKVWRGSMCVMTLLKQQGAILSL